MIDYRLQKAILESILRSYRSTDSNADILGFSTTIVSRNCTFSSVIAYFIPYRCVHHPASYFVDYNDIPASPDLTSNIIEPKLVEREIPTNQRTSCCLVVVELFIPASPKEELPLRPDPRLDNL